MATELLLPRSFHGGSADAEYVRIPCSAAVNGEAAVERISSELLGSANRFDAELVRQTVRPERPSMPAVAICAPDLHAYDALLEQAVS